MVYQLVHQWVKELKEYNYMTWLTTVVALGMIFVGLRRGYEWYAVGYEQKAQLAMVEALEEYDRAFYQMIENKQSVDVIKKRFEDTHVGFDVIFNSYDRSRLLASAYGFSSTAYWYSDKKNEAEAFINKAIDASKKSPLFYVFKIKKAIMMIDQGLVKDGLDQLSELANDPKNPQADTAAFYLGYYYWSQEDKENAKKAWLLLEKYDEKSGSLKQGVSPWVLVAREKMNLIS